MKIMKTSIGLIGKGKTGGKVLELASNLNYHVEIFDSSRPFTSQMALELNLSAVIVFVPGLIFVDIIPELIKAKIPVVIGATGFEFPKETHQSLVEQNTSWIHGTNFSLGMRLIEEMIKTLKNAHSLFNDYKFSLHEIHHTKKLDAPSGTALSMQEWIGEKVTLTSERTGDVIGDHILSLITPFEKITLRHEALDRKIFASGAMHALKLLLDKKVDIGLHKFENIIKHNNKEKNDEK